MKQIRILPELKALIPPLSPEEFSQLEQNCIAEGIRDPLVIAFFPDDETGEVVEALADGHNRLKVAEKNGLKYSTIDRQFDSLGAVKEWMIKNQFGRRNLPLYVRGLLALELEKIWRPKAKENLKIGAAMTNGAPFVSSQKAVEPVDVTKQVAAAAGIGQQTISRIKKIQEKAAEETRAKISAGKISINEAYKEVRRAEKEEKRKEYAEQARQLEIPKDSLIDLRQGDFMEALADIPDNSVDLILTDPPYPYEYIEEWSKLGEFAARVLKPKGFCIAYCGHIHLPEVMQRLGAHLDYHWIFGVMHTGFRKFFTARNWYVKWKPILVYQKGFSLYKPDHKNHIEDFFAGTGKEKSHHEWQQSEDELSVMIEYFSEPDGLIVEPFSGGGTTAIAAAKAKRRVIACEIDEDTYHSAKKRISDAIPC